MNSIEKMPEGIDPITAHHIKAIKMITDSLFPRKRREIVCHCGGLAVWHEGHWFCSDCEGMWAN